MAKLSDMTVTVELTDKAQSQLDYMQVQIESIRAEITDRNALRERLARTEEKLGAMNATCSWQNKELLTLQDERNGLRQQCDALKLHMSRAQMLADSNRSSFLAMAAERDVALSRAERAEQRWADIPWESLWAYFSHGDYGPGTWREIDEWLRENMPKMQVQP